MAFIGRFCAIARGVKFIMNGANHKLSGLSTYPFQIFGNGWELIVSDDLEALQRRASSWQPAAGRPPQT